MEKKVLDKKTKEIKENLTYSLFKLVLEEFLLLHPQEQHNENVYMALMVVCIEIVFYSNNSTFLFEDIENQVNIPTFDMWKACDFFANFDKNMPAQLKGHIIDI